MVMTPSFPRPGGHGTGTAWAGEPSSSLCLTPVWSVPAQLGEIQPINDDIMEEEEEYHIQGRTKDVVKRRGRASLGESFGNVWQCFGQVELGL